MKNEDKSIASKCLLTGDLERLILEKIKIQWKTIRKAFTDLNIEKTGSITKKELRFVIKYWGMEISDEEFVKIFNRFDLDGDGLISYKDF